MNILEQLNNYDENLTLLQIKNIINNEKEEKERAEGRKLEEIRKKFNNSYIKIEKICDTYGKSINIYHIKDITDMGERTYYKNNFFWRGNKIFFSKNIFNFIKVKENLTHFILSESDLINGEIIDQSDYNLYLKKYKKLNKILKNIK